jgi:hypothetical protein
MRDPFSIVSAVVVPALMAATTLLPAPAAAQARTPVFTADQEACFGSVYDRTHLASHPQQKVTSIHVLRSLGERREAENWQPDQRDELIKKFRAEGQAEVLAFVNFRDRKGTFYNSLSCNKEGPKGVLCYIDCDGGSFNLKRANPSALLLENEGFVLVGGCADEVAEGKEVYFKPGKDDKLFRLDARPVAACRAEEQKACRCARRCRCASASRKTKNSVSAATTTKPISRAIPGSS